MQHGQTHGPEMERQADAFAAALLMPKESVFVNQPPAYTIKYLLVIKRAGKRPIYERFLKE